MEVDIHTTHIRIVEAVNKSKTTEEHHSAYKFLMGYRQAIEDLGYKIPLIEADMHYINQGIDRPMCCGVWLDWTPTKLD